MKKQYLSIIFIALLLVLKSGISSGQGGKSFTLNEAINYALENNFNIKSSKLDFIIQHKKVKEYIAIGLPQVSSNLKYNYFLKIPTSFLPDFITPAVVGINEHNFGLTQTNPVTYQESMPVQFGTKHNATWDISLSQLVFNGSFLVGLQANKELTHLSEQTIKKTEIDTREAVAKAYYLVLIAEANKGIIDSTLVSLNRLLNDTREFYKNGFVENTDVDQFELLVSNLEITKNTVDKKAELAGKLLKFQMGYPVDEQIILSDNLETLFTSALSLIENGFDYTQYIDYKMLETQKILASINLKYEKSKYLPTINAIYSFSENAMRNKFDVFDFSQKWYPTNMIGLQIGIPIFNSGSKMYRVQQAKFSLDKIELAMDQVKNALRIQEESARTDYQIAVLTYENRKKSLGISKKIYDKTKIKYKEGLSTSVDLSQTYNQYLTVQSDYINSLLQLLNTKQVLDKIYTKSN